MTAEEVRSKMKTFMDQYNKGINENTQAFDPVLAIAVCQLDATMEIAAQLAELNKNILELNKDVIKLGGQSTFERTFGGKW